MWEEFVSGSRPAPRVILQVLRFYSLKNQRSIASRCLEKEPVLLALGEKHRPDSGGAADFPRSCETRDLTHNSFRSFASAIFKLGNTVVIHSFDSIDLPGFFVG